MSYVDGPFLARAVGTSSVGRRWESPQESRLPTLCASPSPTWKRGTSDWSTALSVFHCHKWGVFLLELALTDVPEYTRTAIISTASRNANVVGYATVPIELGAEDVEHIVPQRFRLAVRCQAQEGKP
jgi:hypothetical protein